MTAESNTSDRRTALVKTIEQSKKVGAVVTLFGLGVLGHSSQRARSLENDTLSGQIDSTEEADRNASVDKELHQAVMITTSGIAITAWARVAQEPVENLRVTRRDLLHAKEGVGVGLRIIFSRTARLDSVS